ncbi:alpha-2-macroglobulin [Oceanobacillus picturae]|uniref:Alpha-2-macroglobulin n=1 Tax=Oceanobacillus picturae TaxID=171693 RepID=A0A0U9HGX2_9BACI|nr:hypothetical protein [Oceanobacillus picturae]GAQ19496.1 alpha-2-macroglobulin [Oceanobacillus picturae]
MEKIDNNTPNGAYLINTRSGSEYLIDISEGMKNLVRKNSKFKLRKDNEPIQIKEIVTLEIGKPAIFHIEPLGLGSQTTRITSEVIDITALEGNIL